jgi:pantetheine-phosphate adenylyltransferase
MARKFKIVAVGGTFDELHKGHRTLLEKAFEVGEHVKVGITSESFVKKIGKPHDPAPYSERLKELEAFLQDNDLIHRADIVELNDAYGLTLQDGGLEALIVSKETEPVGRMINEKRKELGRKPLNIVVIDMVPSENHCPISTTRIRSGEIDREGRLLRK